MVKGKGTVIIKCKLSDGSNSSFRIIDVLYVPNLSLPLFSWRKIRHKGYELCDNGNVMTIQKDNKIWLEAHFDGPLPLIPETEQINDFACNTYEFWHKALCHASSVSLTGKLSQNPSVIPQPSKNFYCEACIASKSTRKLPKSVDSRKTEKGSYIHSDLCGPFPVPSLGKCSILHSICG